MLYKQDPIHITPLRQAIIDAYRMPEDEAVNRLITAAQLPDETLRRILQRAEDLVAKVRNAPHPGGLDAILRQYDLSSEEGIALMCVAEALLRIPDAKTVDKLLEDKLTSADWSAHLGKSGSLFANAVTWGLMVTGKLYQPAHHSLFNALKQVTRKSSGIVVRPVVKKFMEFLGRKFVMGETIEEALKRAAAVEAEGYRYSYDMLGEAARTDEDAKRYLASYHHAIDKIGAYAKGRSPIEGPGISIKLSALHPRYEFANKKVLLDVLVPRVRELVLKAKEFDIALTVDAEESNRLDIELEVIDAVFSDPALGSWDGFGVAVQSYQKRAPYVLDFLHDLAKTQKRRMTLRLIKGAYWDYEIKYAQENGFTDYPVFTRKHATDVSYIACAKKLIGYADWLFPQFATHNAYSIAMVLELVGDCAYEFQCLHGMGQKLYDHIVGVKNMNLPCRIYAPVGSHQDLLGYLMRRLLENGANTSFVNLIANPDTSLATLLVDPVKRIASLKEKRHSQIPLPKDIYGLERKNSVGCDLTDMNTLKDLKAAMDSANLQSYAAVPLVHGEKITGTIKSVLSPIDQKPVGTVVDADEALVKKAYAHAAAAQLAWNALGCVERAQTLLKMADLLEEHMPTLMAIAVREAGKTPANAVGEVREAVDFCRYYAELAKKELMPKVLKGPTGEFDQLSMHGRGVFVCISPWNFPLAIFIGQIAAALVAGNSVLAKPAEQTPLIAHYAVSLFHKAGVPTNVLQFLSGKGSAIGNALVDDERLAGIMFTGSTDTAKLINRTLAKREGAIVPFVAETGGQNVMLVDSSALPEQVTADVLASAFDSAGQRCSALRVLYLQEEVADKIIAMIVGGMKELRVNDPAFLTTDVGPVIDKSALAMLQAHAERMRAEATLLYQCDISAAPANGHYFGPCAFELKSLSQLPHEIFGPILHIIRYKSKDLDQVINDINATGYGLTMGIHSRISQFAEYIESRTRIGNTYVNRNMIGAVVGVQPFGGEGLSGTGPKAGGPHYLYRLCSEKTLSVNTTAAGGNASLLTLTEED